MTRLVAWCLWAFFLAFIAGSLFGQMLSPSAIPKIETPAYRIPGDWWETVRQQREKFERRDKLWKEFK